MATGAHKRRLNIPGEDRLAGKGVVYCSACDGPLFRDSRIAIVGGGNAGLEAAIEMNGIAQSVVLSYCSVGRQRRVRRPLASIMNNPTA